MLQIMNQATKFAVGVMLLLFFSPPIIGAIVVTGMAIPAYGPEPQFAGPVLDLCGLVGFFSLLMCIVGVQLVRKNIRESAK
jgi:hypothetical protein